MSEPLILSIKCDVKGLGVTYRTQCGEGQPRYNANENYMILFEFVGAT